MRASLATARSFSLPQGNRDAPRASSRSRVCTVLRYDRAEPASGFLTAIAARNEQSTWPLRLGLWRWRSCRRGARGGFCLRRGARGGFCRRHRARGGFCRRRRTGCILLAVATAALHGLLALRAVRISRANAVLILARTRLITIASRILVFLRY